MFTIEKRRRYLLRTLFVLLCVVPTLWLAGLAVWRSAPFHHRAEEAKLGRLLGLTVRFNDVTHPRPGVSRYAFLQLREPETGDLVARIESLEVSGNANTLRLVATRPVCSSMALASAWELLDRLMRGRDSLGAARVRLMIDGGLMLLTPYGDQAFREVIVDLEEAPPGLRTQLTFRMMGDESDTPATVKITRDRKSQPSVTAMELTTGDSPLPCSLLAPFINTPGWLGPDCHFHGRLWSARRREGWDTQIAGWFSAIDLEQFVSEHFDHHMTGQAQVALSRALIHDGRIAEAQGAVVAGPGQVSRSLISAARDALECPSPAFVSAVSNIVSYDRFAFDFALDSHGLSLQGRCAEAAPGTLLAYQDRVLLEQPQNRQPVSGLIRAMAGIGGPLVPLSHRSEWLMRVLPDAERTAALDITRPGRSEPSHGNATGAEPRR